MVESSRAAAMGPRNVLAFNNRGVALPALGQSAAAGYDFRHGVYDIAPIDKIASPVAGDDRGLSDAIGVAVR